MVGLCLIYMGFFRATIHCREAEPISGLPLATTGRGEVSGDLGSCPCWFVAQTSETLVVIWNKGTPEALD